MCGSRTTRKRPITFVFNGGPGAASAYLHLGAIGPKAVEVTAKGELLGPPPRLVANDASWLDFTDLVFVDPVGTGYSRASEGKDEGDFWGVEQDTESLADFIRLYLIDAGRMASPVFLTGESYGGFRAATITRALQKTGGISPSGLVLISPALEFALLQWRGLRPAALGARPPLLCGGQSREQRRHRDARRCPARCKRPSVMRCRTTSWRWHRAPSKAARPRATRSRELTGLPVEIVRRNFARIPPHLFIKEFDRANGQVLSRYDGSVSGPDPNPASAWPHGPDPVLDSDRAPLDQRLRPICAGRAWL